jgi:hypothetical protein
MRKLSRRRFITTIAAATAVVAMPYIRGSRAAGKLSQKRKEDDGQTVAEVRCDRPRA